MSKRLIATLVIFAVSGACASAQNATDPAQIRKDKIKEAQKQVEAKAAELEKKAKDAVNAAQPADMANMTPEQMMAAYEAASAPGAEHKQMQGMAGTWDCTVSAWMAPGAPAMTSTGTSVNTSMFDGRYIQQKYSGEFMGKKFEGLGFTGFNKATGKYEGVWMDSMGGAISYSSGEMSPDNKQLIMYGTETDPMTKQSMKYKDVVEIIDADHHTMTRYYMMDGQEMKGMEIKYVRKGGASAASPAAPALKTTAPASTPKAAEPKK